MSLQKLKPGFSPPAQLSHKNLFQYALKLSHQQSLSKCHYSFPFLYFPHAFLSFSSLQELSLQPVESTYRHHPKIFDSIFSISLSWKVCRCISFVVINCQDFGLTALAVFVMSLPPECLHPLWKKKRCLGHLFRALCKVFLFTHLETWEGHRFVWWCAHLLQQCYVSGKVQLSECNAFIDSRGKADFSASHFCTVSLNSCVTFMSLTAAILGQPNSLKIVKGLPVQPNFSGCHNLAQAQDLPHEAVIYIMYKNPAFRSQNS